MCRTSHSTSERTGGGTAVQFGGMSARLDNGPPPRAPYQAEYTASTTDRQMRLSAFTAPTAAFARTVASNRTTGSSILLRGPPITMKSR